MKSAIVVGSINMDLVTRCERVPLPGETVAGSSFVTHHGGKGANQAVASARLGVATEMIGCVGDDSFGGALLKGLRDAGVCVAGVTTQGGSSGVAVIQVDAQCENRITVVAGANAALTPHRLARYEERIAAAGMVLTQLETPMPTIEMLAALCTRHGVPLMLDPAPAAPLGRDLLERVQWLTPNLSEACALLGCSEPARINVQTATALARSLLDQGPSGVLLKLGAAGLMLVQRNTAPLFQAAFAVTAVDTTAAGDTCNAAFAACLLRRAPLPEALRFAAAAGALSVTREGAQPSLPTSAEVEVFMTRVHS